MKTVKVKRMNQFDESVDIYTEFFKPYELTSFDDTFCIAMTNSARYMSTNTKTLRILEVKSIVPYWVYSFVDVEIANEPI